MREFTVAEAKADLDAVLEHARQGGTVIIKEADGKAFELVSTIIPKKGPRRPGMFKGKIKIAEDFDDPLPEFEPYM